MAFKARDKIPELRKRDGDFCALCDLEMWFRNPTGRGHMDIDATVDHIVTKANGGLDHSTNLRLAHRCCNSHRDQKGWDRERCRALVLARWRAHTRGLQAPRERPVVQPTSYDNVVWQIANARTLP